MQSADLPCPACRRPLPNDAHALAALSACPSCGGELEAIPFPALGRGPRVGRAAEATSTPEDAACFQHPGKRAVVPCDGCGRFLCALCDLEIEGNHLCPACLEAGRRKGTVAVLERSRTRWDRIATALTLLILVCGVAAPVSAIANTAITVLQWRKPQSRVAPSRAFLLAATILSWVLTVGLGWLVWTEFSSGANE